MISPVRNLLSLWMGPELPESDRFPLADFFPPSSCFISSETRGFPAGGSVCRPLPVTSREQAERLLNPDRYQLAAVDEALKGITDPAEAWEILQTRGLIPEGWLAEDVLFVEKQMINLGTVPPYYPGERDRRIVPIKSLEGFFFMTIESSQPLRMALIRAMASDPDGINTCVRLMGEVIKRFKNILKGPFDPRITIGPVRENRDFMGGGNSKDAMEGKPIEWVASSLAYFSLPKVAGPIPESCLLPTSEGEDYVLVPRTPQNRVQAIPESLEPLIHMYREWKKGLQRRVFVPEIDFSKLPAVLSLLNPELIGQALPENPFEPLASLNGVLSRGYVPGGFDEGERGETRPPYFPLLVPLIPDKSPEKS